MPQKKLSVNVYNGGGDFEKRQRRAVIAVEKGITEVAIADGNPSRIFCDQSRLKSLEGLIGTQGYVVGQRVYVLTSNGRSTTRLTSLLAKNFQMQLNLY